MNRQTDGGKGDKARPVDLNKYRDNHDKIFSKAKKGIMELEIADPKVKVGDIYRSIEDCSDVKVVSVVQPLSPLPIYKIFDGEKESFVSGSLFKRLYTKRA